MTNKDLIQQYLPEAFQEQAMEFAIADEFVQDIPDLIVLILESRSIDTHDEKQNRFNLLSMMNTDQIETTASMSADGTILFFSRELDDMKNGTDLYMSRKLPNGTWGVPVKLPEVINTKYNESFPHLSYDGKTFYFSSEGHSSMGGFDIFVSEYDDLTGLFSVPKNLGYPINTVDDDFNISMSATGRYGYTSQFRQGEGFGESLGALPCQPLQNHAYRRRRWWWAVAKTL